MLRYLSTLLIMAIRWPTPVPFTSKDRVACQINGKTTISKEKKMNKEDIWVGILLLITCSISNKTSLLFSKKETLTHFKTSYKTWKHFQKINIVIQWENWLGILHLCSQMFRFSKSHRRLLFYPKGKVKKHRKDLWDCFWVRG